MINSLKGRAHTTGALPTEGEAHRPIPLDAAPGNEEEGGPRETGCLSLPVGLRLCGWLFACRQTRHRPRTQGKGRQCRRVDSINLECRKITDTREGLAVVKLQQIPGAVDQLIRKERCCYSNADVYLANISYRKNLNQGGIAVATARAAVY